MDVAVGPGRVGEGLGRVGGELGRVTQRGVGDEGALQLRGAAGDGGGDVGHQLVVVAGVGVERELHGAVENVGAQIAAEL